MLSSQPVNSGGKQKYLRCSSGEKVGGLLKIICSAGVSISSFAIKVHPDIKGNTVNARFIVRETISYWCVINDNQIYGVMYKNDLNTKMTRNG